MENGIEWDIDANLPAHRLTIDDRVSDVTCACGDFNCAFLDTIPQEEKDRFWAKARFARQITVDCSHDGCGAKAGALCDTPGVWVHLERFVDTETGGTKGMIV